LVVSEDCDRGISSAERKVGRGCALNSIHVKPFSRGPDPEETFGRQLDQASARAGLFNGLPAVLGAAIAAMKVMTASTIR
jgi:hypothetical protein